MSPKRPISRYLQHRKRSLSEGSKVSFKNYSINKDRLNGQKLHWPRSGPLLVQLYPSRLVESTNVMHVNHLIELITREKILKDIANVVTIADGGPDWSVKGIGNFMSLGYLWMNLKLDTLVVQCYAPGHSRFNPIERTWSYLTNQIIGVTLPNNIDGKIPTANDEKGWMEVLDNATILCARFWNKKMYSGFPISVETFLSSNPLVSPIKATHKLFKEFTNSSKKKIEETPEFKHLQLVYSFLVKHANRKPYQLEFIKCSDHACEHCSTLPLRENPFLELIRNFGGCCPTPAKSIIYQGHYDTFLEILQRSSVPENDKNFKPTAFGMCDNGCSYTFFSKQDEKCHMKLMKY